MFYFKDTYDYFVPKRNNSYNSFESESQKEENSSVKSIDSHCSF
jgi:hypothetical protein